MQHDSKVFICLKMKNNIKINGLSCMKVINVYREIWKLNQVYNLNIKTPLLELLRF